MVISVGLDLGLRCYSRAPLPLLRWSVSRRSTVDGRGLCEV